MRLLYFLKVFFSAFFVFILQVTVLQFLKIGNTKLDLILIFVIYTGLKSSVNRSVTTGFIFGLIEDMMSISSFGINTISKTLVGFFAGSMEVLHKDNKFAQMIIVFIFTLLDSILVIIFTSMFKNSLILQGFIISSLPITVLYNSLLAPLCFYLFSVFVPSGRVSNIFDNTRKTGLKVSSNWSLSR